MNNEPVAWMLADKEKEYIRSIMAVQHDFVPQGCVEIPLYTHPVKELTDEEIAKVVHELNQKANTPERWVTAMQIGAETIIQLRDELRKASEK